MRNRNRGVQDEWRDIPGYDGVYQVNWDGEIRSWRKPGQGNYRREEPMIMTPFTKGGKSGGRRVCVKLSGANGRSDVGVMSIVVDTWLGGRKEGLVPYHKNGDKGDNCVGNIGFATPKKLGELTGANSQRRPVAKVDEQGNVLEVYPSAVAAGRANYISDRCVTNRCNGLTKRHGGLFFVWDD